MKEKIGGWEINQKVKDRLSSEPDVALSDLGSKASYYWVFGQKIKTGDPPVSLFVKTVKNGYESIEATGAKTREDAVFSMRFENRRQIMSAEKR